MFLEKLRPVNTVPMIPRGVPYPMPQDPHEPEHSTADPFAALGLPRRFDLDKAQIETAFLTRVAGAHPDLEHAHPDPGSDEIRVHFDNTSTDLIADPTAQTAALTEARAVLTDPERRARALVRLLDPAAPPDRTLPDGFLMEMMQLREQIEEELAAGAASGSNAARQRWEAFANERRRGHIARFAAIAQRLTSDADAATDTPALSEARAELNAWRYTERLIEQLDPAARHPGGVD